VAKKKNTSTSREPVSPEPVPPEPIPPCTNATGPKPPRSGYIPHSQYSEVQQAIDDPSKSIINLFGLGGIGKTALLTEYRNATSRRYYYCDLRNARSYKETATMILNNLFQDKSVASSYADNAFALTEGIQKHILDPRHNVVLIFDNLESIMGVGSECGKIRSKHAGYDSLFRLFLEYTTNSSLVLSGRERIELNFNRNDEITPIRLLGLNGSQTKTLLASFKLNGDFSNLSKKYLGNPQALKMAASSIVEDYAGDINKFLANPELPGDVFILFQEHFKRLDQTETIVLLWLAVIRESAQRDEILRKIVKMSITASKLTSALKGLEKRCLVETLHMPGAATSYYLQGVILDFSSDYLIEKFVDEMQSKQLSYFHLLALINTASKEYIIDTQKRLLVKRIIDQLKRSIGEEVVLTLLRSLVDGIDNTKSYAVGNIVNLYACVNPKIDGFDFSNRWIINADLRSIYLQKSNFTNAIFEGVLMRNTYGTLIDVRYSYEGKFILGAATEFSVGIWDAESLQFVEEIAEHHDWVRSVDSNSKYIVSGSNDERVIAYSYDTKKKIKDDGGKHSSRVRRVRLSPANTCIVYSSGDSGKIIGWNIENNFMCELALSDDAHQRYSRVIWDFVFVNNGRQIVSVSDDKTVRLWDVASFEDTDQSKKLYVHTDRIKSVAYDGDKTVFCGCDDGSILEINIATSETRPYKYLNSIIWSLDYCSVAHQLICGHDDGHISLWQFDRSQAERLSLLRIMLEHSSKVWAAHFNQQGSHFVTSSDDFEFKVWNAGDYLPLFTSRGYTCLLRTLAVSDVNNAVIVAGDDLVIRRYALDTGVLCESYTGHNNHVRHLDWSACTDSFLSASDDGQVICWGTACKPLRFLKGHAKRVWAVAHIDGDKYASVGEENEIYIWDSTHDDPIEKLVGHNDWIWDISYCDAKKIFATASEDDTCIVWEYSDEEGVYRQKYAPLSDHKKWLFAVAFSPTGDHLITCSADNTAIVYETATGELLYQLKHDGWVWSATFIDENTVVTGSADSKIRVWRLGYETSGVDLVKTMTEHTSWVVSLGYSKQENILFSASADWTAKKWDASSYEYLGELHIDKPYDGIKLDSAKGLTQAEIYSLIKQGAIIQ